MNNPAKKLVTLRRILTKMKSLLAGQDDLEFDQSFVEDAIQSCEDCATRLKLDAGPGYFRPLTPERNEGINKFYETTALSMYNGFVNRMNRYAEKGDEKQKRMAKIFIEAQQ